MTQIQRDIYERIYSSHWFLTSYNGLGFVRDFKKLGGGDFISELVYVMENDMCRYIFRTQEFEAGAAYTARKLINNPAWRKGLNKKIDFFTKKYFEWGEKIRTADLTALSDKQLAAWVRQIIHFQHWHQTYSVLANGVMLDGRNHLSDLIRGELRASLKHKADFDAQWSFLTLVTQMSLRQKKDYQLALLAQQSKNLPSRQAERKLAELHRKYCWLDYNNLGPAASLETFKREYALAKEAKEDLNLPQALKQTRRKQQALEKKLKLAPRAKFLLALARQVIAQKALRKDMQYHGFFCYEFLFKELARRFKISDWQTLSFLFPWEVEGFILKQKPGVKELQARRQLSCFIVRKKTLQILTGRQAKKYIAGLKLKEDFFHLQEAVGQCAYVGTATGRVRLVQKPADMYKMKKGDILFSQATSPDLLPAMKKAGAIVTNTGGLICHAAITSRELKIPCVVGTGKGTLIFKDNDLVEVDATRGRVRKLSTA